MDFLGRSALLGVVLLAASGMARAEESAGATSPAPESAGETQGQETPAAESLPEPAPPVFMPPPPPPSAPTIQEPAPPEDTAYGRAHSMHLGLSLGIGGGSGGARFAGGVGFAYFVATGIAPGVDLNINGGSDVLTTTAFTGTLRLVPIRAEKFALFLIGRAGRLFISSHSDLWAAGGGAGVVVAMGRNTGLLLSYEVLGLWPSSHCSDLTNGCRLDSFGLGLILGL
jgi:hypothetical protein